MSIPPFTKNSNQGLPTLDHSAPIDENLAKRVELEKELLYDFLIRMTGHASRASDATSESIRIILKTHNSKTPYPIVRAKLFQTARNLCADIWGADTSSLTNLAFNDLILKDSHFSLDELQTVEAYLNRLTGRQKEILILINRNGFIATEVSQLLEVNESVDTQYDIALKDLALAFNKNVEITEKAIKYLPLHPLQPKSRHFTRALSDVMIDLQERRSIANPSNYLRLSLMLALVFILLWIVWNYVV